MPYLIWGAGIKSSGVSVTLNQIDFVPLIASLIGVSIPINNIGVLPFSILNASSKYIFKAAYTNLLQVFLYLKKNINLFYLTIFMFFLLRLKEVNILYFS